MLWYVVHTQPQAETRAAWRLRNLGFRRFPPRINIVRRHARRIIPVLAPLFPHYLFDRFDLDVANCRVKCDPRGAAPMMGAETELQLLSYAIEAA